MANVTLYNDFHNSQTDRRLRAGDTISPQRVQAIRRSLCGIGGCLCGDALGMRGPQPGLKEAGLVISPGLEGSFDVFEV